MKTDKKFYTLRRIPVFGNLFNLCIQYWIISSNQYFKIKTFENILLLNNKGKKNGTISRLSCFGHLTTQNEQISYVSSSLGRKVGIQMPFNE